MMRQSLVLIPLFALIAGCSPRQPESVDRFEVVRADDSAIWKMDRQTGAVWLCWVGPAGPVCRAAETTNATKRGEPASAAESSPSAVDFSHLWK